MNYKKQTLLCSLIVNVSGPDYQKKTQTSNKKNLISYNQQNCKKHTPQKNIRR